MLIVYPDINNVEEVHGDILSLDTRCWQIVPSPSSSSKVGRATSESSLVFDLRCGVVLKHAHRKAVSRVLKNFLGRINLAVSPAKSLGGGGRYVLRPD